MKKKYNVKGLDCANCANKIQEAIGKLDGVKDVNVSFMLQKITLDADDARITQIEPEIVAICKRIEPDCKVLIKG